MMPNSTRVSYFIITGTIHKLQIFSVDCPLGSPIPRVGEYVHHPVTEDRFKVNSVSYCYPTDITGIVNHVKIEIERK